GWAPPFPALPNPVADTLILARRLFPGRQSYKLQDLARDLGIPALAAHRAEDDARLCMEIFLKCAAAG
ncbi:MAG: 3'-5' exonuclease, partial [Treponema sp.]|nr:3'-5' exonuclease [Treponema sp.]